MKLSEIVKKFRGDRKQRAVDEFHQLGKTLSEGADDASIDADQINNVLDVAGLPVERLDQEVKLHKIRAGHRAFLATADALQRESQSKKDSVVAKAERLQNELNEARIAAFEATMGHQGLCQRIAGAREFLYFSAPAELRAKLADASARAVNAGTKAKEVAKQLKACDVGNRTLGDPYQSAESRAAYKAANEPLHSQLNSEEAAAIQEAEGIRIAINNA